MNEPIRILHVLGSTDLGGAESRIMDLYRQIDKSRVQFDFLVHTNGEGYFDKEISEMGGHVYRVPPFRVYNLFLYWGKMQNFFSEHHEFSVVQGHMTSTASIYLPIAKKNGVPMCIAHARSAGVDKGLKGIITKYLRRNLGKKADMLFTCSGMAAEAVFGKNYSEKEKVRFIPNAIDASKYTFNELVREKVRKQLNLSKEYFVIGHVGRFHYAKNHEFLLEIFAALCQLKEDDSNLLMGKTPILLLVGEGEGKKKIKQQAEQLEINEKILFLNNQKNIYDYYQVMDYLVFPSRYEGLPGTVVEAQAAGLQCLISDCITKESIFTELVIQKSIEEAPKEWAHTIIQTVNYRRTDRYKQVSDSGFDVVGQADKMMKFYEKGHF